MLQWKWNFYILFRHDDMSHNATCGYEGGVHESHDPDLFKDLQLNRLSRVSFSFKFSFFCGKIIFTFHVIVVYLNLCGKW